jgi:hypothetical protein
MPEYNVKVRPQHERIAAIAAQDTPSAKKNNNHFVYEGKSTPVSVVTLPIDMMLYRMGNGRTQTDQLAYISAAGADATFFSAHEEDVAAQKEQHKILVKLADEGSESIMPIIEELKRTGQIYPILITQSGVVLDGNRRLAAMRELFATGKYPKFADIECEVLPNLTPDQLNDVEDRLQMRPETKLPYSWVNDAIRVRMRLTSKDEKQVSYLMRREKAELKKAVQALAFADIYLKEWCKAPNDYERVASGQQFFFDLVGKIKDDQGPLREANMRIAWILFDNRKNLGTRVYDFKKIYGNPEVVHRLSENIGEDAETDEDTSEAVQPESEPELEIDFGEEPASSPYSSLIKILDDENRREEVLEELLSVCQFVLDSGKAKQKGQAALIAARDANTRLMELDLSEADPKTWTAIEKQLAAVAARAAELTEKLKEIREKADQAKAT